MFSCIALSITSSVSRAEANAAFIMTSSGSSPCKIFKHQIPHRKTDQHLNRSRFFCFDTIIGNRFCNSKTIFGQCASFVRTKHVHSCKFFNCCDSSHNRFLFCKLLQYYHSNKSRTGTQIKIHKWDKWKITYLSTQGQSYRNNSWHCDGDTTDNDNEDVTKNITSSRTNTFHNKRIEHWDNLSSWMNWTNSLAHICESSWNWNWISNLDKDCHMQQREQ